MVLVILSFFSTCCNFKHSIYYREQEVYSNRIAEDMEDSGIEQIIDILEELEETLVVL